MTSSSKRILVTGAAGFLGSHLCDRLIERGHEVIGLDDLCTGSRANLRGLEGNPRFKLLEHDIRRPYEFDVHEIYNLACPASPVHYQRDPIKTTMTSVMGTLNGLELAKKRGARFFQASTSEVYGDPEVHPQVETYWGHVNPNGPRACYDEGKRCAETLVMDMHRKHNVDVRIVRIFNTYGPRMALDDGRVVSNFIVEALRNEPLTVYGSGKQTRSFCYVDDLIAGFIALMEHPTEIGPVNLGNPNECSMLDLAECVLRETKSRSKIEFRELPQDDPRRRLPDITKAKTVLGFVPQIPLEEGVRRTTAAMRLALGL